MRKKSTLLLTLLLVFLSVFFTGCGNEDKVQTQTRFDEFTNELFLDSVTADSISLNYTLSHPENYGITSFTPTFGELSTEKMQEKIAQSENWLIRLKKFKYTYLTKEQQLTYDILKNQLTEDTEIGDYLLYQEILSPTTGFQAQLPVLLAEYNFYTKENIVDYLNLLPDITNYFNQIIEFEKQKSEAGLFMSDFAVDDITNQCETFIAEKENNLLITVFNDKIDNYKGLSAAEKKEYKKQNKKAVLNHVIPAYEALIKTLQDLKGTGTNQGGLCNFKNGKAYYELLVKSYTGSDKSLAELTEKLDKEIDANFGKIRVAVLADSDLLNEITNVTYPLTNPEEIIDSLKQQIKSDYPELEDVNCTIKYVHKSLEDYLSPAFYLTPALDNWHENNIYINRSHNNDLSKIFTTLGHEGYPGHLYQIVYFNQQNPNPIRSVLTFKGYAEGWATYAEYDSYSMIGLNNKLSSVLQANTAASLCLSARADIGINYEGWDMEKASAFFKEKFGISDEETIKSVYNSIVEEPGNFLMYAVGYLEFKDLRQKAESALGKKFSAKAFHEFILKSGPCQFYVLEDHMNDWIKEQK